MATLLLLTAALEPLGMRREAHGLSFGDQRGGGCCIHLYMYRMMKQEEGVSIVIRSWE